MLSKVGTAVYKANILNTLQKTSLLLQIRQLSSLTGSHSILDGTPYRKPVDQVSHVVIFVGTNKK